MLRSVCRGKRGFSLVEAVIAMGIIGVMIALAISASVIGLKNQKNSSYRILAAGAAGEMYSAFSRTYYDGGFYGSTTSSQDACADYLTTYNGEIAAGLNLSKLSGFSVSNGFLAETYELAMDSVTYYEAETVSGETAPKAVTVNTRGIEIANGDGAYKFTYTYYVRSVAFDDDEFTYSVTEQFTVTAEIDLTSGYAATVTANINGYTSAVFEEVASYAQ